MKFKYSIRYPDRAKIDYFENPISSDDIMQLLETFKWKTELKKEIEFYKPSLDFIKLDDKTKFIISGIGDGRLEAFHIIYIKPKSNCFIKLFNKPNYKNGDTYSQEVTISKGYSLLQNFINGERNEIKKSLKKKLVEKKEYAKKVEVKRRKEHKKKVEVSKPTIKKLKPKSVVANSTDSVKKNSDYEQTTFRILGTIVVIIFFLMAVAFYSFDNEMNFGVILFGGISIFYLIGTINHESNQRK